MSRTPDVVDGGVVQAAWGNEIRDRTIQVFAARADLDAWAAPSGSFGIVTATNVLFQRRGTVWVGYQQSGAFDAATDGNGDILISHALAAVPAWVQLTPSVAVNATFSQVSYVSGNATVFRIRCRNYAGITYANATRVTGFWQVGT